MTKKFALAISLMLSLSLIAFAGPKKATATPQTQRRPSSTSKAPLDTCEDLTKTVARCAVTLNPPDGALRERHALKECYLTLMQKRHDLKTACVANEKAGQQVEDLKAYLAQYEQHPKDQHVSSSRGLEGFGVDLMGHLSGNQRTPANQ